MAFSTKKVSLHGKDCEPKHGVSNAYDSVMQGGIDGNCYVEYLACATQEKLGFAVK